jgi:hypothetical protein
MMRVLIAIGFSYFLSRTGDSVQLDSTWVLSLIVFTWRDMIHKVESVIAKAVFSRLKQSPLQRGDCFPKVAVTAKNRRKAQMIFSRFLIFHL